MYLNKIKQCKDSMTGSLTSRNVRGPNEKNNEAHLLLKRTLRKYEDLVDEIELQGEKKESRENTSTRKNKKEELSITKEQFENFIEVDFTNVPENTNLRVDDDLNLLELDIKPTPTSRVLFLEPNLQLVNNNKILENDFVIYDSTPLAPKKEDDDFFSLIANRPSTFRANLSS